MKQNTYLANAIHEAARRAAQGLTPEQIEAKRAAMRDQMERVALTLELIDARRRLLGDKVDRNWERELIERAIGDIDPSPDRSSSDAFWRSFFGGTA
jgi:F0F1-type ATP synthase membrane subunit b/b'